MTQKVIFLIDLSMKILLIIKQLITFQIFYLIKVIKIYCYVNQEFIADRYGTSIEDLVEKSRAISFHTLITNSSFMEMLMGLKHNEYHSSDCILIKLSKEQQKRTVRQILIPYSLSGIWILFSIELYSKEIQDLC